MTVICGEPLGASYSTGVVVCILPVNHIEDHDGGLAEKRLVEDFVAQMLEEMDEHERD